MTFAYDHEYRKLAIREATRVGVPVHEGVYLAVTGPSYETPAEIHAFKVMGADVVGMSTVPEVIVARHANMRVLAISCVTNLAAGRNKEPLTHKEVMETGEKVRAKFLDLLKSVIPQMAAGIKP
jgi:purine-nucleoside phosphorylase